MDTKPPRSVLVLKPSSFGDIIHTLPAVARLKTAWPAARISWLINPEWAPLLAENPDLDEIVDFPRHEFRGWKGGIRFLRWQRLKVQKRRPDLVIDFQGLLRSAVVGYLSVPGRFYGMADAREGARWFYHRTAPMLEGSMHAVEKYLALADFALRAYEPQLLLPGTAGLRFSLPMGEPPPVQALKHLANKFVLLHPFARGHGKSLSVEQVNEFCRQLAPLQIVLVGRKAGHSDRVAAAALDLLDETTLHQLIWIIRRAACVISVDSGPVHLAAALGRPLIALHTWTDPRKVGPYRNDAWISKSGHLVQMQALSTLDPSLFTTPPHNLTKQQIGAICALATSLSDSCA